MVDTIYRHHTLSPTEFSNSFFLSLLEKLNKQSILILIFWIIIRIIMLLSILRNYTLSSNHSYKDWKNVDKFKFKLWFPINWLAIFLMLNKQDPDLSFKIFFLKNLHQFYINRNRSKNQPLKNKIINFGSLKVSESLLQ